MAMVASKGQSGKAIAVWLPRLAWFGMVGRLSGRRIGLACAAHLAGWQD
jgi:hypothetical protein